MFNQLLPNSGLNASGVCLWYGLMYIFSINGWRRELLIQTSEIAARTTLSRFTIARSREKLSQLGLIRYLHQSGACHVSYEILPFSEEILIKIQSELLQSNTSSLQKSTPLLQADTSLSQNDTPRSQNATRPENAYCSKVNNSSISNDKERIKENPKRKKKAESTASPSYSRRQGVSLEGWLATLSACVRILSETVGTLPVHLYRKTDRGRELASYHPCSLILSRPNSYTSRFALLHYLMVSCTLWGNGYVRIYRDRQFRLVRLQLLHPTQVEPVLTSDDELFYRTGKGELLPSYDMLHLKGLSTNGYKGKSPIAVHRDNFSLWKIAEAKTAVLPRHLGLLCLTSIVLSKTVSTIFISLPMENGNIWRCTKSLKVTAEFATAVFYHLICQVFCVNNLTFG